MTPEQEQALAEHVEAIAAILYADSEPATMVNLEAIELRVRQQVQQHVSPGLGSFLSAKLPKPQPGKAAP